jgi:hypothetical protein
MSFNHNDNNYGRNELVMNNTFCKMKFNEEQFLRSALRPLFLALVAFAYLCPLDATASQNDTNQPTYQTSPSLSKIRETAELAKKSLSYERNTYAQISPSSGRDEEYEIAEAATTAGSKRAFSTSIDGAVITPNGTKAAFTPPTSKRKSKSNNNEAYSSESAPSEDSNSLDSITAPQMQSDHAKTIEAHFNATEDKSVGNYYEKILEEEAPTSSDLDKKKPSLVPFYDGSYSCGDMLRAIRDFDDTIRKSLVSKKTAQTTSAGITVAKAVGGFVIGNVPGAIGMAAAGHLANEAAERKENAATEMEFIVAQHRSMMIGVYNARGCMAPILDTESLQNAAIETEADRLNEIAPAGGMSRTGDAPAHKVSYN